MSAVIDQVRPFHIAGRVKTLHAGHFLGLANALVIEMARSLLLFDLEVQLALQQAGDPVGLGILPDVIEGRARDDQRRPGLVDQDAVDLVDDRVVQFSLALVLPDRLHVVAQIVEAELVVGSVSDVAGIHRLPIRRLHLRLDGAHGHAQAAEERAHPLGVAAGEVIIDRDDVHALAVQRVEIRRQGRDQRFALAGDHLGDVAAVQHHAAHELDVEMAHVQKPPARLASGRERFGQEVVERLTGGPPAAELLRLGLELLVGKLEHPRFQFIHPGHQRPHRPNTSLVGTAEKPHQPLGHILRKGRECVGRLIPKLRQHFHCCMILAE